MSFSQHNVQLTAPLRGVRLVNPEQRRQAEEERGRARQEGFHEGFELGQKSMGEQLVQQRTQLVELQRGILDSLTQALPRLVAQCEGGLVKLALECSRRVVAGLPVSAELVQAVLREALQEVQGMDAYRIRMHPEDLALLQEVKSASLPAPGQDAITIAADPAIQRGGCVLDTPFGTVDATREAKWNHLEELLRA